MYLKGPTADVGYRSFDGVGLAVGIFWQNKGYILNSSNVSGANSSSIFISLAESPCS